MRARLLVTTLSLVISCQSQPQVKPEPKEAAKPPLDAAATPAVVPELQVPPQLVELDEDTFFEKVRRREEFTVIFTHPSCGITPKLFGLIAADPKHDWSKVFVIRQREGRFGGRFMASYIPYLIGWPFMFHVREKTVVDYVLGMRSLDVVKGFIARNRDKQGATLKTPQEVGINNLARHLVREDLPSPLNLSGADLSELELTKRSFSGSHLKGTSFNRTKLKFVTFSQADLTGATFEGAELTFVFWGDTICPDGTPSRDHDFTCEGHGAPKQLQHQEPANPFKGPFRNPDGTMLAKDFLVGIKYMYTRQLKTLYREPRLLSAQETKARLDQMYESEPSEGGKGRIVKMRAKMEGKDYKVYDFADEAGLHSFLLAIPSTEVLHPERDAMSFDY